MCRRNEKSDWNTVELVVLCHGWLILLCQQMGDARVLSFSLKSEIISKSVFKNVKGIVLFKENYKFYIYVFFVRIVFENLIQHQNLLKDTQPKPTVMHTIL